MISPTFLKAYDSLRKTQRIMYAGCTFCRNPMQCCEMGSYNVVYSGSSYPDNSNAATSSPTSTTSSSFSSVSSISSSSSSPYVREDIDELEARLEMLRSHNSSLEKEHERLCEMKQQVDHEIERVLKRHMNHCYLTLDDLARFEAMLGATKEVLVVVNAPYDTDITVHQKPSPPPAACSSLSSPTPSSIRARGQPYPPIKVNNNIRLQSTNSKLLTLRHFRRDPKPNAPYVYLTIQIRLSGSFRYHHDMRPQNGIILEILTDL